MPIGESFTSSANGACGRQARHDSSGMRPVTIVSGWRSNRRRSTDCGRGGSASAELSAVHKRMIGRPSLTVDDPSALPTGWIHPVDGAGSWAAPGEAAGGRVDGYELPGFYGAGVQLCNLSFQPSDPAFEAPPITSPRLCAQTRCEYCDGADEQHWKNTHLYPLFTGSPAIGKIAMNR
jgi:hypothetical protein